MGGYFSGGSFGLAEKRRRNREIGNISAIPPKLLGEIQSGLPGSYPP